MPPLRGDGRAYRADFHAVNRAIVVSAGRRHGVLGAEELAELGLTHEAIARRVRNGWLTELFPAAYAVGHHNLTRRSYWRAAVISCGEGSYLSHRAAAQLSGMAGLIPGPPHVTIPNRRTLARDGIVIHRTRHLPSSQVAERFGIPVTTPERTLLDFASQASSSELRDAVRAALRMELIEAHRVARICREAEAARGLGGSEGSSPSTAVPSPSLARRSRTASSRSALTSGSGIRRSTRQSSTSRSTACGRPRG